MDWTAFTDGETAAFRICLHCFLLGPISTCHIAPARLSDSTLAHCGWAGVRETVSRGGKGRQNERFRRCLSWPDYGACAADSRPSPVTNDAGCLELVDSSWFRHSRGLKIVLQRKRLGEGWRGSSGGRHPQAE